MPRTQLDPTIAPESEALIAREASRVLEQCAAVATTGLRVQITDAGREVTTLDMPASAVRLIRALLKEMGDGKALTLVSDETEITTQQAAEILHVSRPYFVGLIEKGLIPARMVGPQRRVMLTDVLTYKADTKAKRREALRERAALDQELGLR